MDTAAKQNNQTKTAPATPAPTDFGAKPVVSPDSVKPIDPGLQNINEEIKTAVEQTPLTPPTTPQNSLENLNKEPTAPALSNQGEVTINNPPPKNPLEGLGGVSQTNNASTQTFLPPQGPPEKPQSPLPTVVLPPAPEATTPPAAPPPVEIKKSPFRFLLPILGVIGFAVAVVVIVGMVAKPKQTNTSSTPSEQKTNTIRVTYWGLWESPAVMENVIKQFEAANPGIKIDYQQQSIKDYRERLQNALANGNGPDIFRFHFTWTPLLSNALAPMPKTVVAETDFENQQYPVVKEWLRSNDGYLGIPMMYEGLGLYYNKQVFEAAGKIPPKTWEELRQTALELTVKNKDGLIQRAGIALGTTSNVDHWSDILGVMMLQNGADLANPNNQLAADALMFYTIFSKTDKVWDDTMPTSTIAFATEKAAMMIGPSWRAHDVRAMNPNLQFGIVDLPQLPDTQIGWASVWAEGVSAKASKATQEAAWKFLSFLNQKETLRSLYAEASKQRLFGEIFPRKDMAEQLQTDPYVAAYLHQAPYAKSWYLNSKTFDNGPNDKISKYYEDAVNAVLGGETPEKALTTAQNGIAQIMSQYRLTR